LAMQVKTDEGKEIRAYFLDMESIVFKLAEYNTSRAVVPVKLDNRLTHAAFKQNPKKAITIDIHFKSHFCQVVTGLTTEEVVTEYGERIRDLLKRNLSMLDIYNEAYTAAIAMYERGKRWTADIKPFLESVYAGRIDLKQLSTPQQ